MDQVTDQILQGAEMQENRGHSGPWCRSIYDRNKQFKKLKKLHY